MSFLDELDSSYVSINNSFDNTINQEDWSNISAIKSKDSIKCPLRHSVKDICINENCKAENSLICIQDQCCFRSVHVVCSRQPILGINMMIKQKNTAIDTIRFDAEIFFDRKQKQLRDFRAQFMKIIDQMKEASFSEAEAKFKKLTESQDTSISFGEIGGKQSMVLIKNHQAYYAKGSNDSVQRAQSALKNFDESLEQAFKQLATDFKQLNERAKNPSLLSIKKTDSISIPASPNFSKAVNNVKTQNPEIRGRKKFADFISQPSGFVKRTPSSQKKAPTQKVVNRESSRERVISRNSSRTSLTKNENEIKKGSKQKPTWR